MSKFRTIIAGGFGLVALGYALGILTAPDSGQKTRKKLKKTADNSVALLEKDLKTIYSETKVTLNKLAKDNPKLTAKLKAAQKNAQKSQVKLKDLISTIHGRDNVDEDLEAALKDAKQALKDLKSYLSK